MTDRARSLFPAITLLQEVQPHQVRETMESPFPPWADPLSRFLFTVPQWIQITGIVVGAIVFALVVTVVWIRRDSLRAWWGTRSRGFRAVLLGGVGVAALTGSALGWQSWSYMHNDNDFCMSCHVMDVPFEKFTSSEHADLQCHDCHQQSIYASARQVYLWVVDRPEEIGEHAPVPNDVCAQCHVQEQPDSVWQRIVTTAGHRVHLESDSLPDLMCVKCHGVEVHRFVPVDETCGQSACHEPDRTQVVLGSMAGQTDLHCVTCHAFTAPVREGTPRDSATAALVPHLQQCFSCHRMEEQLVAFDPTVEPHGAVCGTCHNPHTQEAPEQAGESCATSACHARADTLTPFHRGLPETVVADCVGCHTAHAFIVDGENCAACHADVPGAGSPQAAGARRSATIHSPTPVVAAGRAPVRLVATTTSVPAPDVRDLYVGLRRGARPATRAQLQDFDHRSHTSIACTDCHLFETSHGEVTTRTERDCMACHHTAPVVNRGCERCHAGAQTATIPLRLTLRLDVWTGPRTRGVTFQHDEHDGIGCADCHSDGITRAVSRGCESCHRDHHVPTADCTRCHARPPEGAHTIAIHTQGCGGSGCHEDPAITSMARTRPLCLSCHQDLKDHRPGRVCAECHRVPDIISGGSR